MLDLGKKKVRTEVKAKKNYDNKLNEMIMLLSANSHFSKAVNAVFVPKISFLRDIKLKMISFSSSYLDNEFDK